MFNGRTCIFCGFIFTFPVFIARKFAFMLMCFVFFLTVVISKQILKTTALLSDTLTSILFDFVLALEKIELVPYI